MPVPEGVWEWPLLAGLLVVVGWVLWTQREERRRVAAEMVQERARHEERMAQLLQAAEADRRLQMEAWEGLVRQSVELQSDLVGGLARLCLEVDKLSKAMGEEHEEILRRCSEEHGRAVSRGQLAEMLEVRGEQEG